MFTSEYLLVESLGNVSILLMTFAFGEGERDVSVSSCDSTKSESKSVFQIHKGNTLFKFFGCHDRIPYVLNYREQMYITRKNLWKLLVYVNSVTQFFSSW